MNTCARYTGLAALVLPTWLSLNGFADAKAPSPYADPLVWDDVVVRGIVVAIENDAVPAAVWYTPGVLRYQKDRRDVDVTSMRMRIVTVIRGNVLGAELTMLHRRFGDARDELSFDQGLGVGDEAIVTAAYHVQLDSHWVWRDVYAKKQDGWRHFEPGRGWVEPEPERQLLTRAEIADLRRVTEISDVILKGTIVSRKDINGSPTRDQEYVVRPFRFIKGAATTDNLVVHVLGGISQDESRWRELLSVEMEEGTSWYLFLREKGDVYVPAAGRHSALLIKDGRLVERLTVPSKYQPSDLEREVGRFLSE